MADEFSSEDEQIEAIQKWIKTHGPAIVVGIAIGLAAIGGWRYWTTYQQQQAAAASDLYTTLTQAMSNDDTPKATGQAVVLKEDYPDSPYAALAALRFAKQAAEDGDISKAATELEWVITHNTLAELVDIARLRLARIRLAEARYDDARDLLDAIGNSALTAELEELRGDIYAANDDFSQARSAYEAARAAAGSGGDGSLLQLKLNNLPTQVQ